MLDNLLWCFKQLFPLVYVSEYVMAADDNDLTKGNKKVVSVWQMWFGKTFNHRQWEVKHFLGETASQFGLTK